MNTKRTVGAAGVLWCVATIVVASPTIDTSLSSYPEWTETAPLRSVVDASPVIEDSAVQPISDNEAASAACDNGGCSNCDACGACNMCQCYEPTCSVTAGAVFLHRSRPGAQPIVIPLAGPGQVSGGQDFDFGWDAGPDLTIERRMCSGNIWQVRYFADDDAVAPTRTFGAVGNVRIGSFSNFVRPLHRWRLYDATQHGNQLASSARRSLHVSGGLPLDRAARQSYLQHRFPSV